MSNEFSHVGLILLAAGFILPGESESKTIKIGRCKKKIRGKKFKYPIGRCFWWFGCRFFQILRK